MTLLTSGVTNDPEGLQMRPVYQTLSLQDYQRAFEQLPTPVREGIERRWGGRPLGTLRSPVSNGAISSSAFNRPEAMIATPA